MLHDLVDIILALRAWTNERHITFDDIPQLGKLIEVVLAQFGSNMRQSGVIGRLDKFGYAAIFRILFHGAELVNPERLAMTSDALLAIDDGQAILTPDSNGTESHERREEHKTEERYAKVQTTFHFVMCCVSLTKTLFGLDIRLVTKLKTTYIAMLMARIIVEETISAKIIFTAIINSWKATIVIKV